METLCSLYFALAMTLGCGGDAPERPEPTPVVEPSEAEKKEESTDGRSTWEWKYEQMCGCEFKRRPLTPEQIAEREAEKEGPQDGRFIFIPNP